MLPRTRDELSNILVNITEIQRMQGRLADARSNCDKAIAIREALIQEFPETRNLREKMGECWLRSGQVRAAAGDSKGAIADWRRALAFYETVSKPQGDIVVYEAGCHALLSRAADMSGSGITAPERHSEAEKAMAILRRLIAGGYHAPHLRSESSLEPLHARDDFQLLLMDVAFPADPFSKDANEGGQKGRG
jgi:hypothetical protein